MSLFLAVLAAINAVFATAYHRMFNLGSAYWNVAVSTALTIVFLILSAFLVVAPGTNQVKTVFGSVDPKPLEAGVHLVNPLADFVEYDLRQQTTTLEDVTLQTQDRLSSMIDISVTLSAKATTTPTMYVDSGTLPQAMDKHVTPALRSIIREVGRTVPEAQQLVNADVQSHVQDEIENKLNEYLSDKGFTVHAVMLRDIELPPEVKQAVVQSVQRKEQIEREKAQLKIVEQQAQQQVVQAQAAEQAAIATANAVRTKADAEAYRIITESKATADGNKEIAKSLTNDLVNYTEATKWNGVLPSTALTGTMPILNVK